MKDILDVHTHTIASGHAYNTIYEMAKAAAEKGLELLGITEHAPNMPGSCHVFYFQNLRVIPREMFGIKVLFGAELNILNFNGDVDLEDNVLRKLDICIASIHPPCFTGGSIEENTNAIVNAIKNPYINIIGHPDDGRYPLDYERIVKAAKEHHVLLEINNSSLSPGSFRPNTRENDIEMLLLCKKYEVPIIMDSDAHVASDIGNHRLVKELLEEISFPKELVVNQSVDMLYEYLDKKKKARELK